MTTKTILSLVLLAQLIVQVSVIIEIHEKKIKKTVFFFENLVSLVPTSK